LLSDPGAHLVGAVRDARLPVIAVPGASALLTALAAAGLPVSEFTFLGFPPRKSKALQEWVTNLKALDRAVVFYEAPHRIRQTLTLLRLNLGDAPIIIARELTKVHEELVVQPITACLAALKEPRGEFTVIIPPVKAVSMKSELPSAAKIAFEVGRLAQNKGLSPRQAAREVADRLGLSVNEVYRLAKSGSGEEFN
jgi:16S rRNA (cytidine1402-2'-O)-methyltransferase